MIITIGFSTKKKNIISRIIRKVDNSRFSHCYIKIESIVTQNKMIYEAANLYVMTLTEENFLKKNQVIDEIDITVDDLEFAYIMDFIEQSQGTPFGLISLIGIGVARLFNLKKNPFGDNKRSMHCSEMVDEILAFIGLGVMNFELITPQGIYEHLKNNVKEDNRNALSIH